MSNIKLALVAALAVALTTVCYTYYAPFPANYESQSAGQKLDFLWNTAKAQGGIGHFAGPLDLAKLVAPSFLGGQDFGPVGWNVSDQNAAGRQKLIHSVGWTAKVRVEWQSNPYTGMFSEAQSHGFMRISSASKPDSKQNTPGFALKMMRDGKPSANLVAMWSLFGQDNDNNYFRHPFSNHVSDLPGFEVSAKWAQLKLLANRFEEKDQDANMVGLSDFATSNSKGQSSGKVDSPFALVFAPQKGVQQLCENDSIVNDTYNCFRRIAAGTHLYDVYYVADKVEKNLASTSHLKKIGRIVSESEFIYSSFFDQVVQFRHVFWADDVAALNKPQWAHNTMSADFRRNDGAEKWERHLPRAEVMYQ